MLFIREIKYFDFMDKGAKIGHVGHAGIELWEQDGLLIRGEDEGEIHIRLCNLPGNAPGKAQAELVTTKGTLDMGVIKLSRGSGILVCGQEQLMRQIEGNLAYADILNIRIVLGEEKEAICRIHEQSEAEKKVEEKAEIAIEVANRIEEELPDGELIYWQARSVIEEQELAKDVKKHSQDTGKNQNVQESALEEGAIESGALENRTGEVPLMGEDKWSHLCNIYPRIRPFTDEREYLQIGPEDFVLLNSKYYPLINNSFMLHGYYHYGRLILTRVIKRGQTLYYLGTPGVFLEREKQVAVMYGFESFECAGEPAAEGDFGYYMIQVEI